MVAQPARYGQHLLRREIEEAAQPRLCGRPQISNQLPIDLCAGETQIGLKDLELRLELE